MPYPADCLDSIDSTNTEAMRRIARGERGPRWIVSAEQTAGKGRSGRTWVSERGNFYASLILPITVPRTRAAELSLIAGIAVVDALIEVAGTPIPALRLKWPNDVLVGTAKMCGILIESTVATDGRLIAVVGIGINLAVPPTDVGRAAAGLAAYGKKVEPMLLIPPLSHSLDRQLRLWNASTSFAPIREGWLARAGHRGEALTVNTGHGPIAGTFDGLDADGALLMRASDGSVRRITFGDVMVAGE